MSELDLPQEPSLESQRVPLERPVVLEFEHFSSFISEYSANISLGGMFVKTASPHLPETVFRFEIRLAEDAPLISGLAKVLWVRAIDQGAKRPAGMGVRFLRLEDDGRALIEQIVKEHVSRGGTMFRLEQPDERRSGPAAAADPPAAERAADDSAPGQAASREAAETPTVPLDKSAAVIELPPLEELLESTRAPRSASPSLDTPPRGWKPGISVARPRTRPQLIATIAVVAAVLAAGIYFLAQLFANPAVLDEADTAPPELPRPGEAAPADAAPPPTFTAVEEITWQRAGGGAEIVVRLDGVLPEGSWSVERMSDPPRHLLKLVGAARPYPTGTFEVGFGGVRQLRTGFHDGGAGNEQHIVVDLIDPRVVLEESLVEGQLVRLRFRRLTS